MMPFYKQPGNGNLSREEFGAHTGLDFLFKDPLFDHFDTDHDGVLSKDEFVEKPFAEMNQNGMLQETTSTICNIETCHAYVHFYLNRCPLLSLCYTCLLTHVYGLSNGSQLFLRNYSLGDSEVSRHEFDHFYTQVLILVYIRWLYLHLQNKGQYYFNFYYHYIVFLQLLHHINQHHG